MSIVKPELSVIIPAYNEATYIDRLLEALARQNFKNFEVIVSDARSKDGTKKVVDSFKNKLNIRLVLADPMGPGYGRNRGAEIARGNWLLFMDADVDVSDPNYLTTLIGRTELKGWASASARMRVAGSEPLANRIGCYLFYHYQKLLAHTRHPVAQGYCILTKREVFKQAGGFSEKIRFGEDNDYISRVGPKWGFGFVDETYYYVDMRRNRQEGWRFVYKSIANEIYRHTHGYDLEHNRYAYDFGKHTKRQK